jgi:5-hydroxyisourate hydrolase
MPNTPSFRLQALSSQLNTTNTLKMATKDPITCHVLDTTTGRPAAHVITTLTCISSTSGVGLSSPSAPAFTAVTNSDGRIANWEAEFGTAKMEDVIKGHEGKSIWQLRFNTGAYYGTDKTFWPFVELTFFVKEGEHFHVPLLLGPHSYTTYRGS